MIHAICWVFFVIAFISFIGWTSESRCRKTMYGDMEAMLHAQRCVDKARWFWHVGCATARLDIARFIVVRDDAFAYAYTAINVCRLRGLETKYLDAELDEAARAVMMGEM